MHIHRFCSSKASAEKSEATEETSNAKQEPTVSENEIKLQAEKEKLEEKLKEIDVSCTMIIIPFISFIRWSKPLSPFLK